MQKKILHKTLCIEKSTLAGPYMIYLTAESWNFYDRNGRAVSTAQLLMQFAKAYCYRNNARQSCAKMSLTETHMATWTITFRWLTENFVSRFLENGAFSASCFVTLSDGSRSMAGSNKFTLYMSYAEFFALSFGTGFIGWRFHLAELCPKQFI